VSAVYRAGELLPVKPVDLEGKELCPNCKSPRFERTEGRVFCHSCRIEGDPSKMKWCEKVPVFKPVDQDNLWLHDGQVYKHNEKLFLLAGYAPGCGRVVIGDFCDACRPFLPRPTERPQKKRSAKKSGKDAATGDREVEL